MPVARQRDGVGWWLLAAAMLLVPPAYTAPSLARAELAPLAFLFGAARAGLMAAAAVVALFTAGCRAVAVPVAVLLAGVGVIGAGALFADSWGAVVGWIGAVAVTVADVRAVAEGP